jgi:hypothetical protein
MRSGFSTAIQSAARTSACSAQHQRAKDRRAADADAPRHVRRAEGGGVEEHKAREAFTKPKRGAKADRAAPVLRQEGNFAEVERLDELHQVVDVPRQAIVVVLRLFA